MGLRAASEVVSERSAAVVVRQEHDLAPEASEHARSGLVDLRTQGILHAPAQERDALVEKKQYLQAVKDYVSSDAYIEQQARRQLGYVRDGEIGFAVVSPPPVQTAQPSGDWWERLFPR